MRLPLEGSAQGLTGLLWPKKVLLSSLVVRNKINNYKSVISLLKLYRVQPTGIINSFFALRLSICRGHAEPYIIHTWCALCLRVLFQTFICG